MCCKLREWVRTETGKGDRLGGDSRLGPSPPSERPAPPPDLKEPHQRPASFICQPVCATAACSGLTLLPASATTPCLLALVCVCPYVSIHHHVRQDRQCLQGLPCRHPHRGDCVEQPVHRSCIHPVYFCAFASAASSIQYISGRSQGLR